MAKWRAQPIYIWFHDKYDTNEENCLPYNPNHFYVHIQGNNEEIDMLQGPITIQKSPKLVEYDPIECFFAHPDIYRVMRSKNGYDWTPAKWESFFCDAMNKKKVLELTVTGKNWVDEVTVEDFQFGPKAGVEKDTQYTIKIKQFRRPTIKKEDIVIEKNYPMTGITNEQYSNNGGNAISAEKSIGANLWLLGPAFLNKTNKVLENKVVSPDGKQSAYFYYMPIEIIQKDVVGNTRIELTEISQAFMEEIKKPDYYIRNYSGVVYYSKFNTIFEKVLVKYPVIKSDVSNLKIALWNYSKILSPNIEEKFLILTYKQFENFFKCLLNKNDLATAKYMQKNGLIADTNELNVIKIALEPSMTSFSQKLQNSYAGLTAPDKKVALVKFLEDVKYDAAYDLKTKEPTVIYKKSERNFWIYEENLRKENKPFKEFKIQWSK